MGDKELVSKGRAKELEYMKERASAPDPALQPPPLPPSPAMMDSREIGKEMSFSLEWTEYHLTSRGWERGSERVDFGNDTIKEPPADRVQTVRWVEEQTSGYGRMHRSHRIDRESENKQAIKDLRAKFGEPPSSL
jgi:hypothetical protein